jgi:hypothetical protein
MLSKTLIIAAAATGLMASAAFAQDAKSYPDKILTPPDKIQDSPLSPNTVNPLPMPKNDVTPSVVGAQTNVSVTVPVSDLPAGSTLTTTLVTNGPVPDTAANRAKYGTPESRAGKMTRPAGN